MKPTYFVGLDLGQAADFTALAVLERPPYDARGPAKPTYALRHLVRYPLGTPYTTIVPEVANLVRNPPLTHCALVVDHTGVGRALVDMLKHARTGTHLIPVTVTAGHQTTKTDDGYHVPKKELVTCLQLLLQARRLHVARTLEEAGTLVEELQNFRVKITAAANETFGAWREGQHDDLVFAVVLACWWAEKMRWKPLRPEDFGVPKRDDHLWNPPGSYHP